MSQVELQYLLREAEIQMDHTRGVCPKTLESIQACAPMWSTEDHVRIQALIAKTMQCLTI